MDSSNPIM